jgi:capsular exopolysaccharide synthesis family protein
VARRNKKQLNRFEHPQLFNASKTLLANIRFAALDEEIKTLVVTSAAANEGKTIVATNLAYAIATSGRSVLIVETDMHYRSLNRLLNQHPTHGLYAALSKTVPLDKVIVSTRIPNLYFMDAEPNIPSPSDILSTKRCASLVRKLREMFDYVIFDTPPVSLFVDAAILSNITDGTLFVTRQNQTKRALAVKCVQQLRVANAHILGLVTTFCRGDDSLYYYAYYTQDGKRTEKNALRHSNNNNNGRTAEQVAASAPLAPAKPVVINSGGAPRAAETSEMPETEQAEPGETAGTRWAETNGTAGAMSSGFEPAEPGATAELLIPDIASTSSTAEMAAGTTNAADAASTIYVPNAYRELSPGSQGASSQLRRRH